MRIVCCPFLYFIWEKNVRFGDMERWNKEVTRPCLESRVTFQSDQTSSILIDIDFTISDFTMNSDLELILDESVTIGTDHDISGCTDPSDYVFDAGPESWYNISNWAIYDRNPDRGGGQLINFCLDTELIPCQSDQVEFDSKATFGISTSENPIQNLTYPGPAATVQDINFLGGLITTDEQFKQKVSTTSAKYNFGDSSFLFGATKSCDDAGCLCREDDFSGKVEVRVSTFFKFKKSAFYNPLHSISFGLPR